MTTANVLVAKKPQGKAVAALAFRAVLLLLIAHCLFAQPPQPRSEEERVAELKRHVVAALRVPVGGTVADVGCGDGFYTIPLARFLGPSGKVFAVDIDDSALSKLKQRLKEEALTNVDVVKGSEDDPRLPLDRLDAALVVNAYHEMKAHEAMLQHIRAGLKPTGVLVMMEGMSERYMTLSREEQVEHHQFAPQVAKYEVESAGFEVIELNDPFVERPVDDHDGKSRWWLLIARKAAK